MTDAMVTARITSEKKERGNRVFEELGTNASQAINRLYDYVIEFRKLPFTDERSDRPPLTPEAVATAQARLATIKAPHATSPSSEMTGGEFWADESPLGDNAGNEREFEDAGFEQECVCFGRGRQ